MRIFKTFEYEEMKKNNLNVTLLLKPENEIQRAIFTGFDQLFLSRVLHLCLSPEQISNLPAN